MENWLSPVSLQQKGHWALATLLCSQRSRNPSWNLPQEIISLSCRGMWVCALGTSACWIHGCRVYRLDYCISPGLCMTSSSFPVPGSLRGTQQWGALLCATGWALSCNREQSGGFLCKLLILDNKNASHRKSCLVCALCWHVWVNAAPCFSVWWWEVNKVCVLRAVSALLSASQGHEAGWWTPVPFYWSVSERNNWS